MPAALKVKVKSKMNKKEKIKNIAIIFLVIMLILTLFSNTILNWSLPEVAVQYPGYERVSQQVIGSGNITAADTYQVRTGGVKTVTGVYAKEGDYVVKDQLLYTLDTGDSDELTAAKNELRSAQDEYDKLLLTNGKDYTLDEMNVANKQEEYEKALDRQQNYEKYTAAYEKAKAARIEAEKAVEELKAEQNEINSENKYGVYVYVSKSDAEKLIAADSKIKNLNTELEKGKEKLEDLNSQLPSSVGSDLYALRQEIIKYESQIDSLRWEISSMDQSIYNADGTRKDDAVITAQAAQVAQLQAEMIAAQSSLAAAEENYNKAVSESGAGSLLKTQIQNQIEANRRIQNSIDTATEEQFAIKAKMNKSLNDKIADAANIVTDLTAKEAEAKTDMGGTKDEVDKSVRDLEYALIEQQKALEEKKENDAIESGKSAIDIATKKAQLDELKEKVEKLTTETDDGSKIVAPVEGILTTSNLISGNKTEAGGLAAEIAVAANGYIVSFSVSNEQARRVTVGNTAEITSGYWYGGDSGVTATLTSIKADETDPSTKKKLVFKIEGDVSPGQFLTLQMGQQEEYLPGVIPNSAIREDNNGKFVLQLQAKNTPLGSRYTAVRVDVVVVATDGKVSAVTGIDEMYAVITTSSTPITPGMQVRLANDE
jgi:hypothetical protein